MHLPFEAQALPSQGMSRIAPHLWKSPEGENNRREREVLKEAQSVLEDLKRPL